jgi:hypothetical protein
MKKTKKGKTEKTKKGEKNLFFSSSIIKLILFLD